MQTMYIRVLFNDFILTAQCICSQMMENKHYNGEWEG
jgi:hypothetical protein